MKILIVDKRVGTEPASVDDAKRLGEGYDILVRLTPEGFTVVSMEEDQPEVSVVTLVHRDVISGDISEQARQAREQARIDSEAGMQADSPEEKFSKVWEGSPTDVAEYPGNHGTAKIKGV